MNVAPVSAFIPSSFLTPAQSTQRPQSKPRVASPFVVITTPTASQTFTAGDTLTVNVRVDPSINATDVVIGMPPIPLTSTTRLDSVNYQGTAVIPKTFSGQLTITPVALDAQQNEIPGAAVTVNVKPAPAPAQIAFTQKYFYIDPSIGSEALDMVATYGDGTQSDVTSSVTGTTYLSSNTAVATVTADGVVTLVAPGLAVITGTNGTLSDFCRLCGGEPRGATALHST